MTFAADVPWRARIPQNTDAAVAFVLRKTGGSKASRELEAVAGLGHDTIRHWLYRDHAIGPSIVVVRRALNALGFDLAIVPLEPE